jgi:small conductance mechanosensitive channel
MLYMLAQASAENIDVISKAEQVAVMIYGYLAKYGLQVLAAIVMFVVGRLLAKLIANLTAKAMTKAKVDQTRVDFVENFCYLAMLLFVIIAVMSQLGVKTTSFVAALAAAGFAIGLALQGSLSNFASGILMIIFKPFKVGDFVEVAGATGVVRKIQLFNTIVNAPDNVRVIIPNSQITGGNILNYSVNGTRRVDLVIGVSYDDDLQKVQTVIREVLSADKRILTDPAPTVAVSELGDSSVNFVVRPWAKSDDYWDVYFDTTEKVKVALEANGISIPYPQRDLHIKSGTPQV